MPHAVYASRVGAHPTRTGAHRSNPPIILVVHTSEGGELSNAAENLASFITTPRTATNLASYHYIADTDRVIPIVPDDFIAYAAGGGNAQGLHICHPGKAAQLRDDWFDQFSGPQLEQVARWIADKSAEYQIPAVKLTWQQVAAGQSGVCGHHDVSLAFKKSTHTDPGKSYPWDWVMGRVGELLAPAKPPPPVPTPVRPLRLSMLSTSGDDDAMYFYSQWEPDGSWWRIRDDKKERYGPIVAAVALYYIAAGVPEVKLPVDELPRIPVP